MGSDVPGKLLVMIALAIGGGLMFYTPSNDMIYYGAWSLVVTLTVIGLINWNVK